MNISSIQRQSVITLFSMIALTAVGFISTIYFAHALGPAPLGAYFLFLAYFGIFNLIGDGGFGGATVKRISERNEPDEYLSAFVFIRIVLLALSTAILIFSEPFLKDLASSGVFYWLILALVVSVFSSFSGIGVYGLGHVGVSQISGFVDTLIRTIVQIFAVFLGFGAAGLTGGFVAGLVAGGLMNLRYLNLTLVRFRLSHIKNLAGFSFWIFLTSSGSLVFSYADTILIGFFMSNADVGIYRTAFQLTSVATFGTLAFHTVLYPKISHWGTQAQISEIENSLASASTYSLFLAIPTCVGGWILGDKLLYYLYGASFSQGASALFFILIVQVVNVFMFLGTMSLTALNRPKDAFQITVIASIANIILDILLIPVLGITGAAIATVIAITINALGAQILLSRVITVKYDYKTVKNILYASGVMSIFLLLFQYFIPLNHLSIIFSLVVGGAGIYLVVLFKLDEGIHKNIRDLCVNLGIPWLSI